LIGEVNDGSPVTSFLRLLDATCPVNAASAEICRRSKKEYFDDAALNPLKRADSLGCRFPVGLDHVLVSDGIAVGATAEKVAIGPLGGTRPATPNRPDPLLAVSDHCPLKATVKLP
jgi:hypothetical protein